MIAKQVLTIIASAISIIAYAPYLKDVLANKTKPHIFSWTIWGLMTGIAFFSQIAGGAGFGSALMGLTTFLCFLMVGLSFKKGTRDIVLVDWLAAIGSIVALVFWLLTKSPYLSVIIITVSDLLATYPTIRKTYNNPHQETEIYYFLNSIKYVLGTIALEKYTVVTALYPIYLVLINGVIFALVFFRKKHVKKKSR